MPLKARLFWQDMVLKNLSIIGRKGLYNLLIDKGKIAGVFASGTAMPETSAGLSFRDAIVLPGLINSHDHLDFNLFPMLGNRVYEDYMEWGQDIHARHKERIEQVLRIPQALRTRWGMYKNLLNGFTTVVNHGPVLDTGAEDIITVFQDCHCLHSLGTEKRWKWKLNGFRCREKPIVLHIGEGTNSVAAREADRLRRWNLFRRPIVGVHGVAMNERQAEALKALVWCPDSNFFLYHQTAPINWLKRRLPILFGTDSTLSATWNGWEQLRLASQQHMLTDEELLDSLTGITAAIWGLPMVGKIGMGYQADLVITKPVDPDSVFATNPEDLLLVMHRGHIRLFDSSLAASLAVGGFGMGGFNRVMVGGSIKYVQGDLPGLIREIVHFDPEAALPVTIPIATTCQ
jgi:cytosine/adenosine deaminase-related metal-dependent hydrolase